MKVIRCYAAPEEGVNVKNIIQDLLAAELDNMLNLQLKGDSSTDDNSLDSDCA
ncbi:hypothetical protein [Priestia aryabhattai]|uniref:hypothetical protein n=1 Tax=Priestia aryabhattai TaxID=412384 RepID=UPI0024530EB0|nr:hypothetical protein [Priestia aryabhattai]MDH3111465.1 hypothetical protein [Priestia aryabhattai]MDH3129614.1 hypothetical protein [Priestia aryabhattai]